MKRRTFIETVIGSTLAGASLPTVLAAPPSASGDAPRGHAPKNSTREVRLERLCPREIDQAMQS
jgi:hypothetical protein